VPDDTFDELWIAACSPSGITELFGALAEHRRGERLVVITPGAELPVTRWTMEWSRLEKAIELGRRDMSEAIELALVTGESIAYGNRAGDIRPKLD
jgi:hypothetical protein